jgi:hypothetical protein
MTREEVTAWLLRQRSIQPALKTLPPASPAVLAATELAVGPLPAPLRQLLAVSNGLRCGRIRVFSAFDERLPKKTWESVQRANDPEKTRALGRSPELLRRFLVFADVGNCYLLWDRTDGTVWYDRVRDADIHRTCVGLLDVLAGAIAEYE